MGDGVIRKFAIALICIVVAGCATQHVGSEYSGKPQKIGIVSLAGDTFQVASERFLVGEQIDETVSVDWKMDQFIRRIFDEQIRVNSANTYVAVPYDSAKLSRIYKTSPLADFGSNYLKALTSEAAKDSGLFYSIDSIKDDLRAIAKESGIDLLVLVTKNFRRGMMGYGTYETLQNGLPKIFILLGVRVYDAKTMEEIGWHVIAGAQNMPKNLWPGRFADLSPYQEGEIQNLLKMLIKFELMNRMQQMGLTR